MSQRKWPLPTSASHQNNIKKNYQSSLAQTSQSKSKNEGDIKNIAIAPDGSIFVKTLVQIDRKFMSRNFKLYKLIELTHFTADSDLFMKVAQSAYADHERSLVQCGNCNRKFFPDRIEKHQSNCAAKKLQSPSPCSKSQQKK